MKCQTEFTFLNMVYDIGSQRYKDEKIKIYLEVINSIQLQKEINIKVRIYKKSFFYFLLNFIKITYRKEHSQKLSFNQISFHEEIRKNRHFYL